MIHVGDITRLSGFDLAPVDCVTGGSPCQDLSVAGRRAGLAGERSGLFMEQVRVIKELRDSDRNRGRAGQLVRPRFMVWENVPGAFSSSHGADFAAVLHETVKIAEPEAPDVPIPSGGWPKAGCLMGAGWSIAWRVHDAQFWGVPQRRKRIALVADFGGHAAPEVLFERKSVSGDTQPGAAPREETAGGAGVGAYIPSAYCLKGNAVDRDTAQNGRWVNKDVSFTLDVTDRHGVVAGFKHKAAGSAGSIGYQLECSATLAAEQPAAVYDAHSHGNRTTVPTLTGEHQRTISNCTALYIGNGQTNNISMSELANSLDTMHDQQAVYIPPVSCSLKAKGNCDFREDSETYVVCGLDSNKNGFVEQAGALQAHASGGHTEFVTDKSATVRRLTPLECERLQGYPDGWTDIGEWTDSKGKQRQCTDTARYKALGNSIALPFWFWLLRRISALYPRPATLGSLFDGIGGFPLCWERCNGPGTALWASEIDDFAIAVTKRRFCDG